MWQLWDSFSHVGGIRWRGQPEIWSYGVFTPMVFSLFKSNSVLFSSLLWLDCAGVNTVITVLLKIKPRGVSLWCERDPTAFWTDYPGVWYGGGRCYIYMQRSVRASNNLQVYKLKLIRTRGNSHTPFFHWQELKSTFIFLDNLMRTWPCYCDKKY